MPVGASGDQALGAIGADADAAVLGEKLHVAGGSVRQAGFAIEHADDFAKSGRRSGRRGGLLPSPASAPARGGPGPGVALDHFQPADLTPPPVPPPCSPPCSPPSGPPEWPLQGPPAESKFPAAGVVLGSTGRGARCDRDRSGPKKRPGDELPALVMDAPLSLAS